MTKDELMLAVAKYVIPVVAIVSLGAWQIFFGEGDELATISRTEGGGNTKLIFETGKEVGVGKTRFTPYISGTSVLNDFIIPGFNVICTGVEIIPEGDPTVAELFRSNFANGV